jgi:hypothetical protein
MFDRADIYVAFIECALSMLKENGELGLICADRWMKNKYGKPLRQYVSDGYHLKIHVDMVDTDAFHEEVSAYPAITVIQRTCGTTTAVAHRPSIDAAHLTSLAAALTETSCEADSFDVRRIVGVVHGGEPWILENFDELDLVRKLENTFPLIEQTGCKIGIGVATGNDGVFVGDYNQMDIEADRKLPLVMTKDIASGNVQWRGKGVINPFGPDGKLISLDDYPKLRTYMEKHRAEISKRHIAEKNPDRWFRTIDRIHEKLTYKPKLLIPDIKGEAHIVYEDGQLYPHHNLYFIVSEEWDLRALQAVMRSGIARLFVGLYSTKMRGGYLRYQAQYLRKIRLPR